MHQSLIVISILSSQIFLTLVQKPKTRHTHTKDKKETMIIYIKTLECADADIGCWWYVLKVIFSVFIDFVPCYKSKAQLKTIDFSYSCY